MRPSPPTGPVNLRDLGGLPVDGGGRIRAGVLVRSDAPRPGDTVPVAVGTVIDLRATYETAGHEHPLAGSAEIVPIPLGASLAPEAIAAVPVEDRTLAWIYRRLVIDAAPELARIVSVAARAEGPLLVHCSAGKDRTGIVVAVLLHVAGVPAEAIRADYLRTNDVLDLVWERLVAAGTRLPEHVRSLRPADATALDAVLDEMTAHPDGLRGHLLAHGAEPDDLTRLRTRLVTPR